MKALGTEATFCRAKELKAQMLQEMVRIQARINELQQNQKVRRTYAAPSGKTTEILVSDERGNGDGEVVVETGIPGS